MGDRPGQDSGRKRLVGYLAKIVPHAPRKGSIVQKTKTLWPLITVALLAVLALSSMAGASPVAAQTGDAPGGIDAQDRVMEDGVVSMEEMRGSAAQYTSCLEELGVEASSEYNADGKTFSYRVHDASGIAGDLMESAQAAQCQNESFTVVERAWADQNGRTQAQDNAFYDSVAGCIADDLPGAGSVAAGDLTQLQRLHSEEYQECFDRVDRVSQQSTGVLDATDTYSFMAMSSSHVAPPVEARECVVNRVCMYKNPQLSYGGDAQYVGNDNDYTNNMLNGCSTNCGLDNNTSSIENRGQQCGTKHYVLASLGSGEPAGASWRLDRGNHIANTGSWLGVNGSLSAHRWCA